MRRGKDVNAWGPVRGYGRRNPCPACGTALNLIEGEVGQAIRT